MNEASPRQDPGDGRGHDPTGRRLRAKLKKYFESGRGRLRAPT